MTLCTHLTVRCELKVQVSPGVLVAAIVALLLPGVLPAQHHQHERARSESGAARPPGSDRDYSDVVIGGRTADPLRFVNASSAPGVVEISLTAAPARLKVLPGKVTAMYTYNGSSPGPTLEAREGDRVIVRFRNELPVETTVHWHGLHIPFDQDGSPFHPVAPGAEHTYEFTLPAGSAGTYWYHPHPHHRTGYQVGMGLYGAIVVRAADDPLPASLRERLLLLSDNRFTPEGAMDFPDPESPAGRMDAENGREGNVIFVSGTVLPTLEIRSGEVQRWRVVNASAARVYRLALEGHTLLHVGSDGGLFEHPVETGEILLGNGERAEFLVRASAGPGTRAKLQALPYNRYVPQMKPDDWDKPRDILTLDYTSASPLSPVALPSRLRAIPALDTTAVSARRVMALSQHLINGLSMDPNRVDVSAELGATEIWEVENLVGMDHPFHLHGFQFQLLDRNGVPEKQRKWKDTVNVPKHQTARLVVRFDNHPGKWMFHCHILDHEDAGMMGVLEVK
jgi:FtsP/CotA-like multicopper oxidase with cupredoxin domain